MGMWKSSRAQLVVIHYGQCTHLHLKCLPFSHQCNLLSVLSLFNYLYVPKTPVSIFTGLMSMSDNT